MPSAMAIGEASSGRLGWMRAEHVECKQQKREPRRSPFVQSNCQPRHGSTAAWPRPASLVRVLTRNLPFTNPNFARAVCQDNATVASRPSRAAPRTNEQTKNALVISLILRIPEPPPPRTRTRTLHCSHDGFVPISLPYSQLLTAVFQKLPCSAQTHRRRPSRTRSHAGESL